MEAVCEGEEEEEGLEEGGGKEECGGGSGSEVEVIGEGS